MDITLYRSQAEDKMVHKEELLSEVATLQGALRQKNVSVINPVIEVAYSDELFNCNYAYIPEFKRYYYINEFSSIVNGMVAISLHVDVLMSFKDEWLQNSGYVDSSLNYGNFYLNDPNTPVQQNTDLFTVKSWTSPFTGSSIVMNCLNTAHTVNVSEE